MYKINKANIFCDDVDGKTLEQFRQCLDPSWVIRGALMPDAHFGYTMPIGGVALTDQMVVPSWVGFDIGCGVCAVPTTFPMEEVLKRKEDIYHDVLNAVPMGRDKHEYPVGSPNANYLTNTGVEAYIKRDGARQFGTLGGGNHFIELCLDSQDKVWIVIHSGSRGTGHEIGGKYMMLAEEEASSDDGENHAFDMNSDNGINYLTDMNWCLQYALDNRVAMLQIIEQCIYRFMMGRVQFPDLINKNHNHAEVQRGGKILHRKGATSAEFGEYGVIPGNMHSGSIIVAGKGNPYSLNSCSHGAGRKLSRGAAKRTLSLEAFQSMMEGIVANVSERTLDESPFAYKDLDHVMEQQEDLCQIKRFLLPIINWKA